VVIASQYPQFVANNFHAHNMRYMEMKDRIRQRMEELDIKQQQLADMVGLSQVAIQKILAGGGTRKLPAIARALATTAEYLEYGNSTQLQEPPAPYDTKSRTMSIPRYDMAASMGNGHHVDDHIDVVERIEISQDYLRRTVRYSSPNNLAIITALGDSMTPTFNDCDLLLVDRGVNEIKLDAVYVIHYEGQYFVKRIQRRPGEPLLMISDNQAYRPQEISNKASDFQVLGRVLMAWNARKL
jgi:phage repressor protein C with HTH and peptisase S24 domain